MRPCRYQTKVVTIPKFTMFFLSIAPFLFLLPRHCTAFSNNQRLTYISGNGLTQSRIRHYRLHTHQSKLEATSDEEESVIESIHSERTNGVLVLLTVPLAWGTFEPAVRYAYAIDPPVPALVFSIGYYTVAVIALSCVALSALYNQDVEKVAIPKGKESTSVNDPFANKSIDNVLLTLVGGIELGFYLFLGNGFQVLGLKTVPSDRAAILLQLTTIMVPLVEASLARNILVIPRRTWIACLIALCGVAVMGLDFQGIAAGGSVQSFMLQSFRSISQGDFYIALAAFTYTFHCTRLGKYAKEADPRMLAVSKATTEAGLSISLLLFIFFAGGDGGDNSMLGPVVEAREEIFTFFTKVAKGIEDDNMSSVTLVPAIGAMVWTGLVPVAYTISAQSYGQRYVTPTDANLIYTVQPLFTALFAWVLLGETLSPQGYAGGALIGSAIYLVAINESDKDE